MKCKMTRLMIMALLLAAHTTSFIRPASAEVIYNVRFTVPISDYNQCTGEWVEGEAEVQQVYVYNAGKVDSFHSNLTATLIGQTSGNRYIFKNNYKDDFSNYVCGQTTYARANARVISLGKLPNWDVNFLVIYEFDAACNPLPPNVTIASERCK